MTSENKIKKWCFSLITGEIFQIEDADIAVLFNYQIPLIKRPSGSCNKCYGRGYFGKRGDYYMPCSCLGRFIDHKNFKGSEINLNIPRLINK